MPAGSDTTPAALAQGLIRRTSGDLRHVVVVGHSASCQVAAHLALLAAPHVAATVLVGPTTDPRAAGWPRLAARWVATARHETPRQVPALVRQYRRTTLRAMFRAMQAARRDPIEQPLREARHPVLVVRGHRDRICPEDWGRAVAGCGGPGSALVTLPAGAHMVPLTHGPLVAGAIRDFLVARIDRPHD